MEVRNRLSSFWVTRKRLVSSWGPQAPGPRLLPGIEARLVAVRSRTNEKAMSCPEGQRPWPPRLSHACWGRFPAPTPRPSLLPPAPRSPGLLASWPLWTLHGLLTGRDYCFPLARRPWPGLGAPGLTQARKPA